MFGHTEVGLSYVAYVTVAVFNPVAVVFKLLHEAKVYVEHHAFVCGLCAHSVCC